MNERLDALSVREGKDQKSYFTRIGVAFANKDGKGYTVMLDAMPAPVDGQFRIMLREPMPKNDRGQSQNRRQSGGNDDWGNSRGNGDDLDDEIPW